MKRIVTFLGLAALSLGLTLPIVAQDRMGKEGKIGEKKCAACEKVTIDKPASEIFGRIPGALRDAGLILAGDVDWNRLGTAKTGAPHGAMPGESAPRIDPAIGTNVHTFLIADDFLVNEVKKNPEHAMWLGKIVVFEKAGKTEILYVKPSEMLEQLKKADLVPAEKVEEHRTRAMEYEKKLDQVINNLKGEKKG